MKRAIALTGAVVLSQAIAVFAGETEVSAKKVIQPAPPLASYFRANEFPGDDLGQQIDGKFTLRYPLDLMFPNLHQGSWLQSARLFSSESMTSF